MLSKSTSATECRPVRFLAALVLGLVTAVALPDASHGQSAAGNSVEPLSRIVVIYPRDSQVIAAIDSTFIFGHIQGVKNPERYRLFVNGLRAPVHPGGGFLAFVPVVAGDFSFDLVAYRLDYYYETEFPDSVRFIKSGDVDSGSPRTLAKTVAIKIPEPQVTIAFDTLMIKGDFRPPLGDLVLAGGDRLEVSFQATPHCRAWFSVAGSVDSVAMSETEPQMQPYWGEAVFGAGAVPDSVRIGGVYSGFWEVPTSVRADTVRVVYHLAPPPASELLRRIWPHPHDSASARLARYLSRENGLSVKVESGYKITTNDPAYPFTVRFTDSVQIIRHEPRKGYFAIFQPKGIEALAVGAAGDWYKLRLSATQYGWVQKAGVEALPRGILPPCSYITSVRMYGGERHLRIEFPLAGRHPFRVFEDDPRTLRIQLFGVTSATDWIRYDNQDKLVEVAAWSQPEPEVYEFSVKLTANIWGYDTYYSGNTLYLQMNKPPKNVHKLKGKTVVVDPGHSRDPGAVGPTGLTEAQANLQIGLALRNILASKGAHVVMTRQDDRNVDLAERPVIATLQGADLFVSIHNNALPDGVNPFVNNGTSAYYYHLPSIELARQIHAEMVTATHLVDQGLFYGNLAVNRPTQYPAVLIECAFMMIPEQEALLKTDRFREEVAKAIARGIERFLKGFDDAK